MKIILSIALFAMICGSGCNSMARSYPYRVVVVNLSQEPITENRVLDSSGKYNYGVGNVGLLGYKVIAGPMQTSPSDEFTVTWKDSQQRVHTQKIDVRSRVRSNFKGELVFVFGADRKFTVEIYESHREYPMPRRPGA